MVITVFNEARLKPHTPPTFPLQHDQFHPPPELIDEQEEYEVEEIWGEWREGRKTQFLVHWKGYPNEDDTWEDEANLKNAKGAVKLFRSQGRDHGEVDHDVVVSYMVALKDPATVQSEPVWGLAGLSHGTCSVPGNLAASTGKQGVRFTTQSWITEHDPDADRNTDRGTAEQQTITEEFCHWGSGKFFNPALANSEWFKCYQWCPSQKSSSLTMEWSTRQVLTCMKWWKGLDQAVSEGDVAEMERELHSEGLTVYIDKG
jgi:hypothetical protein